MEKQYLLDTNILSDLIRNPAGPVAQRIRMVGEQTICTSLVVAAELRFGARKRGSKRLSAQLEAVLGAMDILPLESPCDQHYADLRWTLERAGTPLGGNDMLIAAQALALGLILVTHNRREFDRIPGLDVEDWLASSSAKIAEVGALYGRKSFAKGTDQLMELLRE